MTVEVFLDNTPGETRGVIRRDGRPTVLLIQRESDIVAHRLGARSLGRVVRVEPTLHGAFVDLGVGERFGFLSMRKADRLSVGQTVEVEVAAEPRRDKGPTLRSIGAGEGRPRLTAQGPTVAERLALLVPGAAILAGAKAIRAGLEAEEEALATVQTVAGVRLSVERTRALVAVDLDHAPTPGRDGRRDKTDANRTGLRQAARLIGLKGWGGLVAIDLVGTGHDGKTIGEAARRAFDQDNAVIGPVNRFGVLMLSLPWTAMPIEERLLDLEGRQTEETRVLAAVRRLRLAMEEDMASPYFTLSCPTKEAVLAAPLIERLGPRARLRPDPGLASGESRIERT